MKKEAERAKTAVRLENPNDLPFTLIFKPSGEVAILKKESKKLKKGSKKPRISIDYKSGKQFTEIKASQAEIRNQKRFQGEEEFLQFQTEGKSRVKHDLLEGNLSKKIPSGLTPKEREQLALDFLSALVKIEEKGMVHGAGKKDLFFYRRDPQGAIRGVVGNFEPYYKKTKGKKRLSKYYPDELSPEAKTARKKKKKIFVDTADDVWSWGIFFYELFFSSKDCGWLEKDPDGGFLVLKNYQTKKPEEETNYKSLIWRMTDPDPNTRIKPQEAKRLLERILREEKEREIAEEMQQNRLKPSG